MPPEWRDSVSIRNVKERFRNCCRVLPRPRQLGAFPQTPLGGRAAPRIPPAKTPATGAPSNRPARCNPSAALTINGNLAFVGRFARYTGYSGISQVYPDKLIRFRISQELASPEYICLVMNSRRVRDRFEAM